MWWVGGWVGGLRAVWWCRFDLQEVSSVESCESPQGVQHHTLEDPPSGPDTTMFTQRISSPKVHCSSAFHSSNWGQEQRQSGLKGEGGVVSLGKGEKCLEVPARGRITNSPRQWTICDMGRLGVRRYRRSRERVPWPTACWVALSFWVLCVGLGQGEQGDRDFGAGPLVLCQVYEASGSEKKTSEVGGDTVPDAEKVWGV